MSFTKGEPMTFDPAVFRQAMSQLPTGVAVVALSEEDRIHAMTVGSFTSAARAGAVSSSAQPAS